MADDLGIWAAVALSTIRTELTMGAFASSYLQRVAVDRLLRPPAPRDAA